MTKPPINYASRWLALQDALAGAPDAGAALAEAEATVSSWPAAARAARLTYGLVEDDPWWRALEDGEPWARLIRALSTGAEELQDLAEIDTTAGVLAEIGYLELFSRVAHLSASIQHTPAVTELVLRILASSASDDWRGALPTERLEALTIRHARLPAAALQQLAQSPSAPSIRHLDLGGCQLEGHAAGLVAWPAHAALDTLRLDRTGLRERDIAALSTAPFAPRLRELDIRSTFAKRFDVKTFVALRCLRVRACPLSAKTVHALAAGPAPLDTLDLGGVDPHRVDLIRAFQQPGWASLRVLSVDISSATPELVTALRGGLLPRLSALEVTQVRRPDQMKQIAPLAQWFGREEESLAGASRSDAATIVLQRAPEP